MMFLDLAAVLTGERMWSKDTGGLARPSEGEVARLAYHFYEARGRRDGYDLEDWLSAERELVRHYR